MSKSLAGQSQLLLPIFVIVFASVVAIATNQTLNMTGFSAAVDNSSINISDNANFSVVDNATITNDTTNATPVQVSQPNESNASENLVVSVNDSNLMQAAQPEKPVLTVTIDSPSKITRGQSVVVKATVANTGLGEAKDVVMHWMLPNGFSVVSGDSEKSCGNIAAGASCVSEIIVQTGVSTGLGSSQMKVEVKYA